MSSWQTPHAADPANGEGGEAGAGTCVAIGAAWPKSGTPPSIGHKGNSAWTALILRMDRIDCERAAGSMAHHATFAEYAGVAEEVRCGWNIHMASRARRRDRLHRIDEPLRIGYEMQTGEVKVFLLRTIDVAESAILQIRRRACGR